MDSLTRRACNLFLPDKVHLKLEDGLKISMNKKSLSNDRYKIKSPSEFHILKMLSELRIIRMKKKPLFYISSCDS